MLLVKLLGRPTVLADGVEVAGPRGNKAWALFAYLVGRDLPVPRDRLAALLFPDAEDGLAALRWNLAQLRRTIGGPGAFAGDPVAARLGPQVTVDVALLGSAPWYDLTDDVDLEAPLLAGLTLASCPAFELWLEGERHRVQGLAGAALREAARTHAAAGRLDDAIRSARRLVGVAPWDESGHELLVRSLARSGRLEEARAHVGLVTQLFLDELGSPPSRALTGAAEPVVGHAVGAAGARRARTLAQLQAGMTAMSAGAPEAGVESLRRAVDGARALQDRDLLVRALTELGSAHVHAVRGWDESGVAVLHEAVAVAERVGRPSLATRACRELAWVEFLRCRRQPAERWLDRAEATVGDDDDAERAWIELIRGSLRSDAGRHAEAEPLLRHGVELADRAGDPQATAMALTHLGRLLVLEDRAVEATSCLRRARECAERAGWLSFVPYPSSWLAELALRDGRIDEADDLFGHAHALAVEVRDPCWESLACRGLGMVAAARGRHTDAAQLLREAPIACRRLPDTYVWIEAYGMLAAAAHAVRTGSSRAATLVDDVDRLASRHGLRELQAEAALLRVRLGLPGAFQAAVEHVTAVDNPVLGTRAAALRRGVGPGVLARQPAAAPASLVGGDR